MVPLIAFTQYRYVFWNLYDREVFQLKNFRIFSLLSVSSAIFHKKNLFYNSVWIRIRTFFRIQIQPKYSESFKFGSTTLTQCALLQNLPPRLFSTVHRFKKYVKFSRIFAELKTGYSDLQYPAKRRK
jgi:hypothetical protein